MADYKVMDKASWRAHKRYVLSEDTQSEPDEYEESRGGMGRAEVGDFIKQRERHETLDEALERVAKRAEERRRREGKPEISTRGGGPLIVPRLIPSVPERPGVKGASRYKSPTLYEPPRGYVY